MYIYTTHPYIICIKSHVYIQVHVGSLDLRANIMIRQIVEVVTDYEKVLYYTIIYIIRTMNAI